MQFFAGSFMLRLLPNFNVQASFLILSLQYSIQRTVAKCVLLYSNQKQNLFTMNTVLLPKDIFRAASQKQIV
jgi:hypothetical protein